MHEYLNAYKNIFRFLNTVYILTPRYKTKEKVALKSAAPSLMSCRFGLLVFFGF